MGWVSILKWAFLASHSCTVECFASFNFSFRDSEK